MKNTDPQPWLIQRIKEPRNYVPDGTSDLCAFYDVDKTPKNKDELNKQFERSIKALNELVPLDYMGSAEFECGDFGKSLRRQCRARGQLVSFQHTVTGVPRESIFLYRGPKLDTPANDVTLHGWCKPEHLTMVQAFLTDEASGKCTRRLKEMSYIQDGCFGVVRDSGYGKSVKAEVEKSRIVAWMDIENDWFAGTDKKQAEQLAALLGITLSPV